MVPLGIKALLYSPCIPKYIFTPGEELVQLLNYVKTKIFHFSLMIMKASSSTFKPNVQIVYIPWGCTPTK